jgi:putative ABC transport system permease protein
VRSIDPNLFAEIKSMDQNLDVDRAPARITTVLAAVLGGFALLLATIGIYGVVSYAVSRRIREIGLRVALGAGRRDVLRLILNGAMRPVILGLVLGVAACAAVSRVLSAVLYGVSPLDPIAFIAVTLFLFGVALLASFLPARRATRIDPMEALRYE